MIQYIVTCGNLNRFSEMNSFDFLFSCLQIYHYLPYPMFFISVLEEKSSILLYYLSSIFLISSHLLKDFCSSGFQSFLLFWLPLWSLCSYLKNKQKTQIELPRKNKGEKKNTNSPKTCHSLFLSIVHTGLHSSLPISYFTHSRQLSATETALGGYQHQLQ